jgi:predicted RNase H-like HicB family nuclease
MQNSLSQNSIRCIVFREGKIWYGTALELNIVETGDTAREAMLLLFEAVDGYLEFSRKINNQSGVLNQKTDPEYEQMWSALENKKKIPSKEIFFFGNLNIGRSVLTPA